MKLVNLKDAADVVSFQQAVLKGLGNNQGLYFPESWETFEDMDALLDMPFVARSQLILERLIGDEWPKAQLHQAVETAFTFPAPLHQVDEKHYCLELFHGPTLAFKDFGGRFMAQSLLAAKSDKKVTILTATSGDTGAAVAHAFYDLPGVEVVILYPEGKISPLQEKLFCTLGKNIRTIAIDGDFDACQSLVKQSFDDQELVDAIGLNSANSINISRLLAQVCYYFEAIAQLPKEQREKSVVSVPSGNFGNLTAGLIAKRLGLPVKRFIAATNANDTVPRYLSSGEWSPVPTKATLSNAMDVAAPNNWPRVENLLKTQNMEALLSSMSISEAQTEASVKALKERGYLSEPHAAVAYQALEESLSDDEVGVFLGTAHPGKFYEAVKGILGEDFPLPETLKYYGEKELLSSKMPADFAALRDFLL
ncbi:threonine synthase [Algicola sagamiensis]|uniref:threonine synthase n=1 Tax=Algicola sagamiensis TaxID=163869 RepID=UPI000361F3EF|nr:threonine synthase [Algicola sagamiensis]